MLRVDSCNYCRHLVKACFSLFVLLFTGILAGLGIDDSWSGLGDLTNCVSNVASCDENSGSYSARMLALLQAGFGCGEKGYSVLYAFSV